MDSLPDATSGAHGLPAKQSPLKVLHLEDSDFDARLIAQWLRAAGWNLELQQVHTRDAFIEALRAGTPDVILADHTLPDFDGFSALDLAQAQCPQVPFVFVTGTMADELVIEGFRRGAKDCVLKRHAENIVPVVERALWGAAERAARQFAVAKLRDREELLQRVMDSSHDCIKLLDLEARLLWMNACGLRVMEIENFESLQNALWLGFWRGADHRAACAAVAAAKGGGKGTFTGFCPTSKGRIKWWEVVITPILDATGQPERLLAVSRDITERKLAEQAIQEREAHLRNLVQALPAAVYTCDAEGRVTFFNEAAATLWGRRPELGKDHWCGAWKLYQTDGRPLPLEDCPMAVALREGRAVRGQEIVAERPDGSRAYVQPYPTPMHDSHGVLTGAVNMLVDVTERRRGEEALRNSAALYASLVENLPQSIFRKDGAGRFTFANQRLCRTLGRPLAEVLGRTDAELFAPELAVKYRADDLRVMATGLPYEAEEEVQGAEAKVRQVQVNKTALLDAAGGVIGIQGVFTDITEKRELEAQFLRAQRLESLGALACGVAHDLNNILAPIMMAAPMLRMGLPQSEVVELAGSMEKSVARGAGVVRQLLTFGRGVEGERGPLQARHLIREITDIAKETFPKNIVVATEVPSDLWPLTGDATQIHQVLLNLVLNARDAMPQGGKLTVQAENVRLGADYATLHRDARAGTYVRIEVLDTGTGIPKAIQERIFDPFFTTKAPGKGTGLGLSTTLGIVKSHGGFIHLYSEQGQGTAFNIYLPAVEAGDAGEAAQVPAPVAQGAGETILVVDDEESFILMAKSILSLHGYYMISARDGVEALSVFAQNRDTIKAVLTDVQMPLMDGVTLVRVLQRLAPQLKVIASSGLEDSPQLAELRELGVRHFLSKPYSIAKLLALLTEVLHATATATAK